MKRFKFIILAAAVMLSLTACADNGTASSADKEQSSAVSSAETEQSSEESSAKTEQSSEESSVEAEQSSEESSVEAEQSSEESSVETEQSSEESSEEAEQSSEESSKEAEQSSEESSAETEQSSEESSAETEQSSEESSAETEQSSEESSEETEQSSSDDGSDGDEPVQSGAMTEQTALDNIDGLVREYDRLYNIYIRCGAKTEDYDYDSLPEDEQGFRYAPVSEYGSISEMKADTEKYVTAAFAETNFYAVAMNEQLPYYKDRDGKLYVIADADAGGENTWDTTSAKVISCDGNSAVVTVEYQDNYGGEKRAEFTLIMDNDVVKIDKVGLDLSR